METGPKFLHSLFEVAHVEFQTFDLSTQKVVFSSGVVRRLLGYSQEEYDALSTNFYQSIIHPDDFEKVQHTVEQILAAENGQIFEMTLRLRKKNGDYIWLHSRQMIYERTPGCGTCTIIREVEDVTKLVALENELKEKVRQLNVVSFKNSHLLRSPVASIMGLISLVEEQAITGEHNRQILQFLKETIIKLDDVIREINDEAREK
ncbi:PAS domain-containing protein [Mucilaginibacter pedocola]|uniref:histidine kinase n=1 Tax=Mucilaginibacter pedocola TaxID=1792845 RepID=A0A1S9PKD8_9SPHI|nr:PAS domain-containing protein [Mucilaginibacter pedocola]OOQ61426.1 hypothetical protein BC343_20895 [Mucilaginibacter pedocola]